mgnify:CR=1 FL=1
MLSGLEMTLKSAPLLQKQSGTWTLQSRENITGLLARLEFTAEALSISLEPPSVELLGRHFKVNMKRKNDTITNRVQDYS